MVRGLTFKLGALLVLLTVTVPIPARGDDTPFPEEMVVRLGQPSVYRVVVSGKLVVTLPKSIAPDLTALQTAFDDPQTRNQFPADASKAQCFCRLIAAAPVKFLRMSPERVSYTFEATSSGSAFAISREGILLTNAHVVTCDLSLLARNPRDLAETLSNPLAAVARQLDERLSDPVQAETNLAILGALAQQQLLTAEAGEIKVQLFGKMPALPRQELRLGGLTPAKELEGGIPAKVVAKGNPYPGRDVAVLRTTRTPANLGVSDPYLLDKDRLICLRLGNSADVEPGMRVQAFGFPGLAFDPAMPDEAKRLVSCQNGQIGQIKPLRGEMPVIFEMTADTNHGDSGGPVLDKHGFVIGLNVAGYLINKDDAEHMLAGHNMAVPIDVAKPFLKAAGIDHLDPGPLTEHWERGLRLYAAEDYAGAEQEFADLLQLQESGGWPSGGLPSLPGAGGDPYVKEVYVRCRIKQGKLKLPTPK